MLVAGALLRVNALLCCRLRKKTKLWSGGTELGGGENGGGWELGRGTDSEGGGYLKNVFLYIWIAIINRDLNIYTSVPN